MRKVLRADLHGQRTVEFFRRKLTPNGHRNVILLAPIVVELDQVVIGSGKNRIRHGLRYEIVVECAWSVRSWQEFEKLLGLGADPARWNHVARESVAEILQGIRSGCRVGVVVRIGASRCGVVDRNQTAGGIGPV